MKELLSAEEYLRHHYEIPKKFPLLPLPDEDFVSAWQENRGVDVLNFLGENLKLPVEKFAWKNVSALAIEFNQTQGGKLPIVKTANHDDFCQMVALLSGREAKKYPLTVNAFTLPCKAISILRHRVILLNSAPYSNISAEKLNLTQDEWLKKSNLIRLRHESAHYETLRLLGGMKNHALDEILADCLGQIAAFGNFDADRQRLFFGLHGDKCDGRLQFYCRNVFTDELPKIYHAVNLFLEEISKRIKTYPNNKPIDFELFKFLASKRL